MNSAQVSVCGAVLNILSRDCPCTWFRVIVGFAISTVNSLNDTRVPFHLSLGALSNTSLG